MCGINHYSEIRWDFFKKLIYRHLPLAMKSDCVKISVLIANETAVVKGKQSKWMTASMCLSLSVVLHVVIAVLICLRILALQTLPEEVKKEAEEDMIIAVRLEPMKASVQPMSPPLQSVPKPVRNAPLTPEELKSLAAKTPAEVKTEPKMKPKLKPKDLPKYARTASDQLTGNVPDTNLLGERDTIAASNAKTVAGAPDRASIRGEKSKDGIEETVDTRFQDGELEHMNKGGEAAVAQIKPPSEVVPDPNKIAEIDQKELKSSVESTKEVGEALEQAKLAETNKEAKKFLETQKKMALNEDLPSSKNTGANEKKGLEDQKKTIANKDVDPDALKQKAQEKKQKKQESKPKTATNKSGSKKSKKGFRSEAKATVMEGTISRRSKIGSKNVKATPVGKYMAQISKLVEQEWQRRCMMHADLIQPGTLRISFIVDERGKVRNIDTISQTQGSKNQESLTFQALMSVKIPPMPKKVRESQGGDPLEFRYYFRFQ